MRSSTAILITPRNLNEFAIVEMLTWRCNMKLRWEGRETTEHTKPVNELLEWIPLFDRTPFKLHNGGTNKYLDVIEVHTLI